MKENRVFAAFPALPENEAFARMVASAFAAPLDPTVEEITEIKTAVSEAVSNAVIHGYEENGEGIIHMELALDDGGVITISVEDEGVGIEDVEAALTPLFTTGGSKERSGMGFTVMESFMDKVTVESERGKGTRVTLIKRLEAGSGL